MGRHQNSGLLKKLEQTKGQGGFLYFKGGQTEKPQHLARVGGTSAYGTLHTLGDSRAQVK